MAEIDSPQATMWHNALEALAKARRPFWRRRIRG
jgi:hypothetical protein